MYLGLAHGVQADVALLAPPVAVAAVAVDELAVLLGAPLGVQVLDVLGRLAPPVPGVQGPPLYRVISSSLTEFDTGLGHIFTNLSIIQVQILSN